MDEAVSALRAFTRFYTRSVGALGAHYLASDLSLTEARPALPDRNRQTVLAAVLQAELGLDAGYVSRILAASKRAAGSSAAGARTRAARPIGSSTAGRSAFDALDARTRADVAGRISALGPPTSRLWWRRWARDPRC